MGRPVEMTHEEFIEKFKETDSWLYNNTEVVSKFKGLSKDVILKTKHGLIKMIASRALKNTHTSFHRPRALNITEFFISEIEELYGKDNFTFEKTKYKGIKTPVTITCLEHGDFEILPLSILRKNGMGCKECSIESKYKDIRLSVDEFLDRCDKKYGERYFYPNIAKEYKTLSSRITVICNICGYVSKSLASGHIQKSGCKQCNNQSLSFDTNEFINRANKTHGHIYDYSNSVYTRSWNNVEIKCKICDNIFYQSPTCHIKGAGCPECAKLNSGYKKSDWLASSRRSNRFESYKLYVIKCYNNEEEFIKVGMTFNTLILRFHPNEEPSKNFPYLYEVVEIITSENGGYIWDLEKEIHKKLKDYKYKPTKEFGGMYECFSIQFIDEIKDIILKIKEDINTWQNQDLRHTDSNKY